MRLSERSARNPRRSRVRSMKARPRSEIASSSSPKNDAFICLFRVGIGSPRLSATYDMRISEPIANRKGVTIGQRRCPRKRAGAALFRNVIAAAPSPFQIRWSW